MNIKQTWVQALPAQFVDTDKQLRLSLGRGGGDVRPGQLTLAVGHDPTLSSKNLFSGPEESEIEILRKSLLEDYLKTLKGIISSDDLKWFGHITMICVEFEKGRFFAEIISPLNAFQEIECELPIKVVNLDERQVPPLV